LELKIQVDNWIWKERRNNLVLEISAVAIIIVGTFIEHIMR